MSTLSYLLLLLVVVDGVVGYNMYTRKGVLAELKSLLAKEKDETSSCTYNLFLTNYDGTGFGGASVSVSQSDVVITGFKEGLVTLPIWVYESGWVVPVTTTGTLTVTYYHSDSSSTANSFFVTDANGLKVLTVNNVTSSGTYTIGVPSCTCTYSTECPTYRVRNEWRSMTYCDKANFIAGINTLRNTIGTDGQNYYEKYIHHHWRITNYVALQHLLLPWHRGLILHMENSLRALGGTYTCLSLPYWDWTLDFGQENSTSFFDDLGGYSYESCLSSPFSNWDNPLMVINGESQCVMRHTSKKLYEWSSIAAIDLGFTGSMSYNTFFKYMVRNPHKVIHIGLGGEMASTTSPADPLFWLHHANVDRIYALWQDCWDYDVNLEAGYEDIAGTNVHTIMPEFYPGVKNSTVYALLNITELGYRFPPLSGTYYRLNKNATITDPETCEWNWFDKDTQDSLGLPYRMAVHSDENRERISTTRTAYHTKLAASGDYYSAYKEQLTTECNSNEIPLDDYEYLSCNSHDPYVGPYYLCANACDLLSYSRSGSYTGFDNLWWE